VTTEGQQCKVLVKKENFKLKVKQRKNEHGDKEMPNRHINK